MDALAGMVGGRQSSEAGVQAGQSGTHGNIKYRFLFWEMAQTDAWPLPHRVHWCNERLVLNRHEMAAAAASRTLILHSKFLAYQHPVTFFLMSLLNLYASRTGNINLHQAS